MGDGLGALTFGTGSGKSLKARGARLGSLVRYGLAVLLFNAGSAAAADPIRIVALGDSLTAGYGVGPQEAFPARLQAQLKSRGIEAEVVNAGVSGDTTAGGLARLDWALADKPRFVIVALGANDALRGIDPKVTRDNLDRILTKVKEKGATPILMGMYALANWGKEYETAFNAIYPELAKKHGVKLYPFFLDGVAMEAALNLPDGLHPNPRGIDILAERIAPLVAEVVTAK
jgi:acyl-CoA thioesterase-1